MIITRGLPSLAITRGFAWVPVAPAGSGRIIEEEPIWRAEVWLADNSRLGRSVQKKFLDREEQLAEKRGARDGRFILV